MQITATALTCGHCGRRFKPKTRGPKSPRYCSDPCRFRGAKGCSLPPWSCERCGVQYSDRKRRFCGAECRVGLYNAAKAVEYSSCCFVWPCFECGQDFRTRHYDSIYCPSCVAVGSVKSKVARLSDTCFTCQSCGVEFRPKMDHQRFCSDPCRNKHECIQKKARHRQGFIEHVSLTVLFNRDNGLCGICGSAVDRSRKRPDPLSPSIDHIVPQSKGGEHSYANCQLAHLGCNCRKGDRPTERYCAVA